GEILDHINHNTLDNRKSNLRPCKNKENIMNMRSRGGTSNFKGVYLDKRNNKWISRIQINYKSIYIGSYNNEIEAAKAYDEAAKKYFKKFAYLNFKDNG